jgi:hypothetical protein
MTTKWHTRRGNYKEKYSLTERQVRSMRDEELDQLDNCQCEEARRILLGVSHKHEMEVA